MLAKLTEAMRALCDLLQRGGLSDALARSPRPIRPVTGANRRRSAIRYGERLAEIGATPSIGTVGDYDNALAE